MILPHSLQNINNLALGSLFAKFYICHGYQVKNLVPLPIYLFSLSYVTKTELLLFRKWKAILVLSILQILQYDPPLLLALSIHANLSILRIFWKMLSSSRTRMRIMWLRSQLQQSKSGQFSQSKSQKRQTTRRNLLVFTRYKINQPLKLEWHENQIHKDIQIWKSVKWKSISYRLMKVKPPDSPNCQSLSMDGDGYVSARSELRIVSRGFFVNKSLPHWNQKISESMRIIIGILNLVSEEDEDETSELRRSFFRVWDDELTLDSYWFVHFF